MAAAANIYQTREARRENRPLDNSYVCQVKKRAKHVGASRGGIFSVGAETVKMQMQATQMLARWMEQQRASHWGSSGCPNLDAFGNNKVVIGDLITDY